MSYREILDDVSGRLGIPVDVVRLAYESFWMYVRETASGLPLKDDLSEEDFNRLRVNFNIPSIGKLCCTYDRYRKVKDRYRHLRGIRHDNDDKEG